MCSHPSSYRDILRFLDYMPQEHKQLVSFQWVRKQSKPSQRGGACPAPRRMELGGGQQEGQAARWL